MNATRELERTLRARASGRRESERKSGGSHEKLCKWATQS